MKKIKWYAYMLLVMGTFMVSCSDDENSANKQTEVKFYLTDAPTSENYKAVNIDIKEVRYSIDGETWENLPITEATYNLLDFTNGKDTLLHYCPLKIASRSLKLLEYSLLQEILMRNDLKS